MTDYVTLLALCDKQQDEIQALKTKVAELEESLRTVAQTRCVSYEDLAKRDLEQQANGVQRLIDNWFDINILDNEDIEVVSAVRFINELHKQAKKLKGGAK